MHCWRLPTQPRAYPNFSRDIEKAFFLIKDESPTEARLCEGRKKEVKSSFLLPPPPALFLRSSILIEKSGYLPGYEAAINRAIIQVLNTVDELFLNVGISNKPKLPTSRVGTIKSYFINSICFGYKNQTRKQDYYAVVEAAKMTLNFPHLWGSVTLLLSPNKVLDRLQEQHLTLLSIVLRAFPKPLPTSAPRRVLLDELDYMPRER